jgi:hypothetical protein
MNIVSSKCKQTAHPQNVIHLIFKGQEYIANQIGTTIFLKVASICCALTFYCSGQVVRASGALNILIP